MSAGRIWEKVGKKFYARVMFITSSKVICTVVDEEGKKKDAKDHKKELTERGMEDGTL